MKKTGILVLTLFLGIMSVYMLNPVSVKAETVEITASSESDEMTGKDIQNALDKALENPDNEYIVTVPEGTYALIGGFHIYSNTTLNLDGVVIKHPGNFIGAMIQVGYPRREEGTSTSAGGGYTIGKYDRGKNIKINGGTFDAGNNSVDAVSSLFTFSHVENLELTGTKFMYKPEKTDNAHMIEFGGAKNILIKDCEFIGNGMVDEALQIESARKGVAHSDLMGKEDGTPTRNVRIEGCKFSGFTYALGTNHGENGDLYKGMVIKNNEFRKIKKYIICTYNYRAKISGNKVFGEKRNFESYILKLGNKNKLKLSKNTVKAAKN